MTAPVPYPISGSATLATDPFTGAQPSADWTVTGDAILIDGWGGSGQLVLFSQGLGFWGSNPELEQEPGTRSTRVERTYTPDDFPGLTPNTYVRVTVGVQFFAQSFGAAGKFIGMYVGDTQCAPNVASSETITPNVGECIGYGTTDEDGAITIAFAAESITVSYDINIVFDNLTIESVGDFEDIIIDTAVVYHDESTPVSITKQGARFDPGWQWDEYDYPGKTASTLGAAELAGMKPVVRTTFMTTGERHWLIYAPGGEWSDGPYGRRYTPPALRTAIDSAAYLTNVRTIWKRLRGDFIQVHFPKAIVRTHGIETVDRDEGGIPAEIEGVQDLSSGTPGTVPVYYVDILAEGATA